MAVTIGQEPYKALRDAIYAQPELMDALATDEHGRKWAKFNQPPNSDDQWPKFIWENRTIGLDGNVDIERYDKREDLLQFSLWLPNPDDALILLRLVDVLEEYRFGGSLNTEHWVCSGLYKVQGGWKKIEWPSIKIDGQQLNQFTSDWMYKFNRRQNVD